MRKLLRFWKSLWRRKPCPAHWESIGSPSYRCAIRELYVSCGTGAIRRTAWGEEYHLGLFDLDHNLCTRPIRGRLPKDFACHPPGYLLVRITTRDSPGHTVWEQRWWPTLAEDIHAEDWEYDFYGQWRPALEPPQGSQPPTNA